MVRIQTTRKPLGVHDVAVEDFYNAGDMLSPVMEISAASWKDQTNFLPEQDLMDNLLDTSMRYEEEQEQVLPANVSGSKRLRETRASNKGVSEVDKKNWNARTSKVFEILEHKIKESSEVLMHITPHCVNIFFLLLF